MASTNVRSNTRVVRASYANKSQVTTAQFRVEKDLNIDLSSVQPGEIIVRNLYLSLDPCKALEPSYQGCLFLCLSLLF